MQSGQIFSGFIYRDPKVYVRGRRLLEKRFGPAVLESEEFDFDQTDYYEREFGTELKRRFLLFKKNISLSGAAQLKKFSRAIERGLSIKGRRRINIDPGYLTNGKVVLLSTKDHQHRIYIGGGIYAEVTLRYCKGTFTAWPWTYPDYASGPYIDFFNRAYAHFKK